MPPRQRLEVRQQEIAPMLQNQDVTTAAVILNNVLGPPLPRLAMNLVTPKDQPIPMGHDCTRCAATATCSLLNKATENEGNNPIMDRINAISLIKNEDPEFIQRATPEDRESLIRAKVMEIKEQRLNVVVEKPQIEVVAQEVKVEAIPIQEILSKNEPEILIENTAHVIAIEKTTPPKKERKKRQEKIEPITLPKELSVERPQNPAELHPISTQVITKTEKTIEKKPMPPQKTHDVKSQTSTVVSEVRPEKKPTEIKSDYKKPIEPVIIPLQKPHITQELPHRLTEKLNQKNVLMERSIVLDKIKRKTDVITTSVDKIGRSLLEMVFGKKFRLPLLINLPNVIFDKNQLPQPKKENTQSNVTKGEIFIYSPGPRIDKLDNGSLILKKSIRIFHQSRDSDNTNRLPLEPGVVPLQRPRSFSLISLEVIDLNRLYKPHDKSKRLKNVEIMHGKKKRIREKSKEKISVSVSKNIRHLLKNYIQEYSCSNQDQIVKESNSNQTIKPERISKSKMEILIKRIQQIISKENEPPFAVIIIPSSHQESLDHEQKQNDQRLFDYEILPISQTEFLKIVNLSTLVMKVMNLLSGAKTPKTAEEVFFTEYTSLLFAPEELQKGVKNQTKNMSIIIWYMVQVLKSINLLSIYLTSIS